ncbi:MAG: GTPase ObgE [Patescibacteria group bacterium]
MAALIDELEFYAKAGRGGDGVVRWLHEKSKEFSGASGGNGGKGGDVYIRAVRDIQLLSKHKHTKEFLAERGEAGQKNSRHGKNGEALYIDLPLGSIVKNLDNGKVFNLLKEGQEILVLKGGRGGLGNEHFKASTNTSPTEWTPGKDGEDAHFFIELELVADAGLVGQPNAGKSSLLNELTNARSKVGNYAFTTLDPALGNMEGFILADIPGLIEGASEGKGLGVKFLRHIKRTKMLFHCVSLENEDIIEIYTTVRKELEKFSKDLADKPELIILTKTDTVDEKTLKAKIKEISKLNKNVLTVTAYDDAVVKSLKDDLVKILRGV